MSDRENAASAGAILTMSWRILPLIFMGYIASFMDRMNVSFAALQMNRELHFSATLYGWAGGLFFLAYAAFGVPSNLMLMRFGARRWIAAIMLAWGLCASGMMFVRTPLEFCLMRICLGAAEAGFFPGVIWYLGHWFPADHRSRAISRFYVSAPLGSLAMSGLAAVLLGLNGRMGLSGWQWLFLIEGLPAIVMSAVFLVCLPDAPERAAFLSAEQKAWIASELGREAHAVRRAARPFRDILLDRHVLQLAAINALSLGSYYAFSLSAPLLLQQSAHLDLTHLARLMALPNILGAVGMLADSWHSDRTGERFLHYAVPMILVGLSYAVWLAAPFPPVIMAAYAAAVIFYFTPLALFWSLAGKFIAPAERAVAYAVVNSGGMIGSFLGPVLFGYARDHTGGYALGMAALPVCLFAAAAIAIGMRRQDTAAIPALPDAAAG